MHQSSVWGALGVVIRKETRGELFPAISLLCLTSLNLFLFLLLKRDQDLIIADLQAMIADLRYVLEHLPFRRFILQLDLNLILIELL